VPLRVVFVGGPAADPWYRQVFGWEPAGEEIAGRHYAGFIDPDTGG
jgi:hypothetical protein